MAVSSTDSDIPINIRGSPAPSSFRLFAIALFLGAVLVLILTWLLHPVEWRVEGTIILWILAVALAGALPLRTERGVSLALDLPVLLAAGYVLGPAPAGLVALVGTFDLDEFRGNGSLWISTCNRAQTALASMAAAIVFHALDVSLGEWPTVALAAFLGLVADASVNYSLVAAGVAIFRGVPISRTLSDMRIGSFNSFLLEYGCFGLLGILLAVTYEAIGLSGLVIFVGPLVLAHELFKLRQRGEVARKELQAKSEAINSLTQKAAEERREERLVVAGELHDELLPPLFKVHLLGQVIHEDLASGRLLDLDEDVPDLLHATDEAQNAVRHLVAALRSSGLGSSGLATAIRLLAEQLEGAGAPTFRLELGVLGGELASGSEHAQLLAYQVAREAMHNAARHAKATCVTVSLQVADEAVRVVVADDGIGFIPVAVGRATHFGLQLMRERVEAAGGRIVLDSRLGQGTCISAAIPLSA